MQIFVDTMDRFEVERWMEQGVVDGVTTNPSIVRSQATQGGLEASVKDLARVIYPRPICVQVCSVVLPEILDQARVLASWADNVVVKIPVITPLGEPCLQAVNTLEAEGISTNCTACMSFNQVLLAAKAGATYVSVFVGRINDEGHDGSAVLRMARQWLSDWGFKPQLIAGSVRNAIDVQQAALAGTHIVTVPPKVLDKLADHRFSRATTQQFLDAGRGLFLSDCGARGQAGR